MRIKLGSLMLITLVSLTGLVPAQQPEDVFRVGYAIVTPDPRNGAPIANVVYGSSVSNMVLETGVSPANLSTNATVYISVDGSLGLSTGIAIANPHNMAANFSFTLTNNEGVVVATSERWVLNAYNMASRYVTDLFPGVISGSFRGTMTYSSDMPLAVLGLRLRGSSLSTIPMVDISATNFPIPVRDEGIGGPGALMFPIVVFGGGFESSVNILNNAANAVYGRIDVYNPDGTPLSVRLNNQTANSFNYTIASRGVFAFENR